MKKFLAVLLLMLGMTNFLLGAGKCTNRRERKNA